jgi:hypothetical protein
MTAALGPVTAATGVPGAKLTLPLVAPSVPATRIRLPRVVVKATVSTFTCPPAFARKPPSVVVIAVKGCSAFLTRLTSRPALAVKLPLVVVTGANSVTSRPAVVTRLPQVAVMASFTTTSRTAFRVRVETGKPPGVLVHEIAVSTVISPLPVPPVLAVMMVTLLPAVSAVTISATFTLAVSALGFGVKTLPTRLPPLVGALVIDTSAGSSNHRPAAPWAAEALTRMPATSSQWPEVSINPPLPPCVPPRALMWP